MKMFTKTYIIFPFLTVLIIVLLILLFPKIKSTAQRSVCEANLKTLSKCMIIYSGGHYDGMFPFPPERWCDILLEIESFREKGGLSTNTFRCPTDPKGSFSYAINENIYKKKWSTLVPSTMVLMFESDLGRNAIGGPDDIVLRHQEGGQLGCYIIFSDGWVEFVTEDRIPHLCWTEESAALTYKKSTQRVDCKRGLTYLFRKMEVYVKENDGILPVENWCDSLIEITDASLKSFICQASDAVKGESCYAMNKNVVGMNLKKIPKNVVLFFESDLGWNGVGGPDDVVLCHMEGYKTVFGKSVCNIVFANGHSECVTEDRIPDLQWTVE